DVRSFDEQVQAARRQFQVQVRDLSEHVTHRHVESTTLVKRQTAEIVDEVTIKRGAVMIVLLDEFSAAQAERVARLGWHRRIETAKPPAYTFVTLQPDVSIDRNELL